MLPRRNRKDPGIFLLVPDDDGVNYTTDDAGVSIGLNNLVLYDETLVFVAEEADVVPLEDNGHDGECSLVSCALQGLDEGKPK